MSYFHVDTGDAKKDEAPSTAPSSSLLVKRIGDRLASSELHLPLCWTCSTQTSYKGADLDIDGEDTEYKCTVCLDPRQYIGIVGQRWTTLDKLINVRSSYVNRFDELIPNTLWTFKTVPAFGIGQRAFLLRDPAIAGLIMWDCVAYIDDHTLRMIDELSHGKGIAHMIVSHPHYYSTTATWLAAFPSMKLWLADADFDAWYVRRDVVDARAAAKGSTNDNSTLQTVASRIELVDKEQTRVDASAANLTILLLGGHFPGSLVLLWNDILFIADTIQVVPSGRYKSHEPQRPNVTSVTFLWSYPNQIPLSAAEVKRVCEPLEKVSFDKAFGAFEGFDIWGHAKDKILQSRDIICKRLQAP